MSSISNKRRWAKIAPDKRSKIMSKTVSKRWAKMSKAQRKAYAMMMVEAKKKKRNE